MLRVSELADIARRLDLAAFTRQMGPFALMQRPSLRKQVRDWSTSTLPLPTESVKKPPAPVDFQDLIVATLPPLHSSGEGELVIGRSPEADLVLPDPAVSSRHAAIRWKSPSATLVELGSANGTFLNGLKLGTQAALKSGDQLAFGRSHFIFVLAAELHARLKRMVPG